MEAVEPRGCGCTQTLPAQLEDEGLVAHEQNEGRNVFSLTDAGREALAARAGKPAPVGQKWAPPWTSTLFELKDIVGQVAVAVRQIAKVATPAPRWMRGQKPWLRRDPAGALPHPRRGAGARRGSADTPPN